MDTTITLINTKDRRIIQNVPLESLPIGCIWWNNCHYTSPVEGSVISCIGNGAMWDLFSEENLDLLCSCLLYSPENIGVGSDKTETRGKTTAENILKKMITTAKKENAATSAMFFASYCEIFSKNGLVGLKKALNMGNDIIPPDNLGEIRLWGELNIAERSSRYYLNAQQIEFLTAQVRLASILLPYLNYRQSTEGYQCISNWLQNNENILELRQPLIGHRLWQPIFEGLFRYSYEIGHVNNIFYAISDTKAVSPEFTSWYGSI